MTLRQGRDPLSASQEDIGNYGTGAFTQTGGSNTINNGLYLGASIGSSGTYHLSGTGSSLSADYEYIGNPDSSTGTFTQTGGSNTISNDLYLGTSTGSSGTYDLSGTGSSLSAIDEYTGYHGSGTFTQTGGTNTFNALGLGWESTGSGSYDLSGGSLSATAYEYIGRSGSGTFTQTGGSNTISGIFYLGYFDKGSYDLSGAGSSLSAGEETIGDYGSGTFTQTGGSNTISNDLSLGVIPGSSGTYSISAGNLEAKNFSVGVEGNGTLKITGPAANITVSNKLSFGPHSTFTAVPGATIHMTGSAFENKSTDPAALAGLSHLDLIFEGGKAYFDPFEVAGQDLGAVMAGFNDNFALGTLTLGGTDTGKIQLSDLFDNQPGWTGSEALYVYNLNIGAGSDLDLNGLNLYYLNGSIAPGATINYSGGSLTDLTPIPEPATFLLLGTGLLGLIGYTRKKISRA